MLDFRSIDSRGAYSVAPQAEQKRDPATLVCWQFWGQATSVPASGSVVAGRALVVEASRLAAHSPLR